MNLRLRSIKAEQLIFILSLAIIIPGCDTQPDEEFAKPGESLPTAVIQKRGLESGKAAYEIYCVGCHGENGDGNGKAAGWLFPPPRDFTLANFKFSSTRSGELPTDDDLYRTIKNGLKGSAMPPFELLDDPTVESLIAYIKTFSDKWQKTQPASPIPQVNDPWRADADKSEAIARGELIYHGYATCWSCHPSYVSGDKINEYRRAIDFPEFPGFRDTLFEAVGKENTEGWFLYPPDFKRDFVRSGADIDNLYRSIAAGITSTAMPTWVDSMDVPSEDGSEMIVKTADLWAMAYYVQDLLRQRVRSFDSVGDADIRDRKRPIYIHGLPPMSERMPKEEIADEPAEEIDVEF